MKNTTAFPVTTSNQVHLGMTLRDYFAGQAMLAVINTLALKNADMTPDNIAKLCYARADAMLKARES